MADNKDESFKFVDRRRVDAEGKDRGVDEKTAEVKPQGKIENKNPKTSKSAPSDQPNEIGFSEFAMSLATQALMQLGQMQPPAGFNIPKDVIAAKQTIDILQMLEAKTKGNLDEREAALMSDILHNLRLAFLNVSQGK
jgi:hypothetical protein